ncbi:hypothetical protein SISSUDRAFT_1062609 [Sistotremastrum suecicum HHB10207 ss-3]|uniref:U3 small nucleolar RNA-associated protein 10 n=1 Tax=Sistotremastrum suecicum HHB10207 ss-3 TaxID=1314776 RepID=A0A166CPP9_9AGAM|nr:hypothetical protein SISSUDRAFT_1062609 [Sistotremastrum suecicum HHB10207 ss-3]
MVSSLAAQLAKGSSLNSHLLVDRSRRKHTESYLFTGKQADDYDIEAIFALASNGFEQLKALDPSLAEYEDIFFSDQARETDRTLQSPDYIAELNRSVKGLLLGIGPELLEIPTAKVLEWLVRHFRIHEFNVDELLSLFLPYHESPHFLKILSILHIQEQPLWKFLLPFKKAVKPLPRASLVTEMLKNVDLTRFVASLLPTCLDAKRGHRCLYSFHVGVLLEYISRSKSLDDVQVALLLPSLTKPLSSQGPKDAILGSYILLSALSQKCSLSIAALGALVDAILQSAKHMETRQVLTVLVAISGFQEEEYTLSDKAVRKFAKLSDLNEVLPDMFQWAGVERFLLACLPSLLRDEAHIQSHSSLIGILLNSDRLSQSVVAKATSLLLSKISEPSELTEPLRAVLQPVQQRHPDIFAAQVRARLADIEGTKDEVSALEDTLVSLSLSPSKDSDGALIDNYTFGSISGDPNVRATSVRKILIALQDKELAPERRAALLEYILQRFGDSNTSVVEALYSDPELLAPLASEPAFWTSLSSSVSSTEASRAVLRSHVTFLATTLAAAKPELQQKIIHEVLFPLLLFTKAKQKTAKATWEIIATSPLANNEILLKCCDLAKDVADDAIPGTNLAIAKNIATNILQSDAYQEHFDYLLQKAEDAYLPSKILALLILSSLTTQLSGEHRVKAASSTLQRLRDRTLSALSKAGSEAKDLDEFTSDSALAKSSFAKSQSESTELRLICKVLSSMSNIPKPADSPVNWLSTKHLDDSSADARAIQYLNFIQTLYVMVNRVAANAPRIGSGILQKIFTTLGDDSLMFLASIWSDDEFEDDIKVAALSHAMAFLSSRTTSAATVKDFQVLIPALLIPLCSSDKETRTRAIMCFDALKRMTEVAQKAPSIYGFDAVYGASSELVQYLNWPDVVRYINTIHDRRDHILNDESYLVTLHHDLLNPKRGESSKETSLKTHITCYILSHVLAWDSTSAQMALLRITSHVHNSAKLNTLLPLIQHATSSTSLSTEYCSLLLSAYTGPAIRDIGSESWNAFVSVLKRSFLEKGRAWQDAILVVLSKNLISTLDNEHRSELLSTLLSVAGSPENTKLSSIKGIIENLLVDSAIAVSILEGYGTDTESEASRAAKRTKIDGTPYAKPPQERLSPGSFVVLFESLCAKSVIGSPALVKILLEVLGRDTQVFSSITLRLDTLVDLIRGSENPQVFNQALLLTGSLCRLAPESMLQNVMPIFTFMGSNVFHRDDAYSFRVVQKTIESVVPVIVASLTERFKDSKSELLLGARDFLRVFTDAAPHIPKHRRTRLFTHFIRTLGADLFTVPVCLLLIARNTPRIAKLKKSEATTALALPLTLLKEQTPQNQLSAINDMLLECRHLAHLIKNPESSTQAFLGDQKLDGGPVHFVNEIQCILTFVEQALDRWEGENASSDATEDTAVTHELMSNLMILATLGNDVPEAAISVCARNCLSAALKVIDAREFIHSIMEMVRSGDSILEAGALDLLHERLPNILPEWRADMSSSMKELMIHMLQTLTAGATSAPATLPVLEPSLHALSSIAETSSEGELSTLYQTVTPLLALIRTSFTEGPGISAMKSLVVITNKLGPRTIPCLKDIVDTMLVVLNPVIDEALPAASTVQETPSCAAALRVLSMSMNTTPSFWSSRDVANVTQFVLKTRGQLSQADRLGVTITKKIPPRIVITALLQTWKTIQAAPGPPSVALLKAYFLFWHRILRTASREEILENLKEVSKLYEQGFEEYARAIQRREETEDMQHDVINPSFMELVVKLNETAFKPIFRRLCDWAFVGPESGSTSEADKTSEARVIVFCHLMTSLIGFFKELITPYLGMILDHILDILRPFENTSRTQSRLSKSIWRAVIDLLNTSFTADQGTFWKDNRLSQVIKPLVAQIPFAASSKPNKEVLKKVFPSFAGISASDNLLRELNVAILMQTRSEIPAVKLCALECATAIWDSPAAGAGIAGYANETATFVAECAEDDNDEVARAARTLRRSVEAVAGSLSGVLI